MGAACCRVEWPAVEAEHPDERRRHEMWRGDCSGRVSGAFRATVRAGAEARMVPRAAAAGVQEAGAGPGERCVVRSLPRGARGLRHLRAAPGGGGHQLPDRRQQACPAVRHGHGDRRHQEGYGRTDAAAGRRAELAPAQRSRRGELAVRDGVRDGHRFHAPERARIARGCAGGAGAGADLRGAARGVRPQGVRDAVVEDRGLRARRRTHRPGRPGRSK